MLLLIAAVPAVGCGGSGTFQNGRYSEGAIHYRVGELRGGWDAVDVEGQNDLAWHHGGYGAVIQVNSTCDPDMDVPLAALRNHLLIGFTEREVASEEVVPMDEREALRTRLTAKLDGVPREMVLTVLKKDGCVYDFALVSPPGSGFERALADYDGLLSGFGTLGSAP